jgi:hypothetical protein
MKIRIFAPAALVMMFAAIAVAADDPFAGRWQEVRIATITVNGDGYSVVSSPDAKPLVIRYGKDFADDQGFAVFTGNVVRVDAHTLKGTYILNGELAYTVTTTIAPDGKHSTRLREYANGGTKQIMEDERVGPVPTGDVLAGIWKTVLPRYIRSVKVDGNNFEWLSSVENHPSTTTRNPSRGFKSELDGKEHQSADRGGTTNRSKRIDINTIEVIEKVPPVKVPEDFAARMPPNNLAKLKAGYERKQLWQIKGDTLSITTTDRLQDGTQTQSSVAEYERVR